MNNKGKWFQYVLVALGIFFVLRFPLTRAIIVWLLPLGSGWDDLVQMLVIAYVLVVLVIKSTWFGNTFKRRKRNFQDFFTDKNIRR